jgi:hypothetical protein
LAPHLRGCALSVVFASISCLPPWFAVPPRWRSSAPQREPGWTSTAGAGRPIQHAWCGPDGPIHRGEAGHIGQGGAGSRWVGRLGRCRPRWRNGSVRRGGAGLVPEPLPVGSDRVDRQEPPPPRQGQERAANIRPESGDPGCVQAVEGNAFGGQAGAARGGASQVPVSAS